MRSAPLIAAIAVHAAALGVAMHAISGVPGRPAEPEFAISFAFRQSAPAEPGLEPRPLAPAHDEVLPPVTGSAARVEPVPQAAGASPAAPNPAPVQSESWLEAVAGRGSGAAAAAAAAAPPPQPVQEPELVPVTAPAPAARPPLPTAAAGATASPRVEAEEIDAANAPPEYPLRARRLGHQGTAVVVLAIDERGRVASATLARSSGSHLLDRAALVALRSWRYRPALDGGRPVATTVRVEVVYRLDDGVQTH